jgi:hypothetical protein
VTRTRTSSPARTPPHGRQAEPTVRHATSVSTGGWTRRRTTIVATIAGAAAVAGLLIVLTRSPEAPERARDSVATPAPGPVAPGSGSATPDPQPPPPPPPREDVATTPATPPAHRERKAPGSGPKTGKGSAAPIRVAESSPPPDAAPAPVSPPDAPPTTIVISSKQPPGPTRFTRPADYNPKRFDATAYAPKALALARSVFPDAGLARFDVEGVHPDGHADLTLPDLGDTSYLFRSPSHSSRPTNIPANISADIHCYVEVTIGVTSVEVRVRAMDPIDPDCKWPLRPLPRCTLASVWKRAAKAGAQLDTVAKIDFLSDGKWFFDNEFDGKGVTESYSDACP